MIIPRNPLYIRKTRSKGRGVFCAKPIRKGQVVEVCPVTIIPAKEQKHIEQICLMHYHYEWKRNSSAIAWGYGSMYNHSNDPNCCFSLNHRTETISIKSLRDIPANQELLIDYGWDSDHYEEKGFQD